VIHGREERESRIHSGWNLKEGKEFPLGGFLRSHTLLGKCRGLDWRRRRSSRRMHRNRRWLFGWSMSSVKVKAIEGMKARNFHLGFTAVFSG